MPPDVTQSFKLQGPDIKNCGAEPEAMLRLIISEHCLLYKNMQPLEIDRQEQMCPAQMAYWAKNYVTGLIRAAH